jgi:hypothetical protein
MDRRGWPVSWPGQPRHQPASLPLPITLIGGTFQKQDEYLLQEKRFS